MKRINITALATGAFAAVTVALLAADSSGTCPVTAASCPASGQASACCQEGQAACCNETKGAKLTKVSYEVNGMSCAACESKVSAALTAIEGVGEAKACATSKSVSVAYNGKAVKEKDLLAAITKAGFQVSAEQVELSVDGLKCGDCSGKVSNAITSLEGIKEQKVCHEAKQALVKFDPNKLTRDQLVAAINKTGFTVID